MFAAGVVCAYISGASTFWRSFLSIFFVVSRVMYIFIYIVNDKPWIAGLRSIVFVLGLVAVIGLFIVALDA